MPCLAGPSLSGLIFTASSSPARPRARARTPRKGRIPDWSLPPLETCAMVRQYPRNGEGHGAHRPMGWWRKPRAGFTAVRTLACGVPETVCAVKRVHVCCST